MNGRDIERALLAQALPYLKEIGDQKVADKTPDADAFINFERTVVRWLELPKLEDQPSPDALIAAGGVLGAMADVVRKLKRRDEGFTPPASPDVGEAAKLVSRRLGHAVERISAAVAREDVHGTATMLGFAMQALLELAAVTGIPLHAYWKEHLHEPDPVAVAGHVLKALTNAGWTPPEPKPEPRRKAAQKRKPAVKK